MIRLGPRVGKVSELVAAIRRIPLRERQLTYWFGESLGAVALPALAYHNPAARVALVRAAMQVWKSDEFLTHCLDYLSRSGLSLSMERVHRFCVVMAAYAGLLERIFRWPAAPSVTPECTPSTPPNGKSAPPVGPNSAERVKTSAATEFAATTASGPKP